MTATHKYFWICISSKNRKARKNRRNVNRKPFGGIIGLLLYYYFESLGDFAIFPQQARWKHCLRLLFRIEDPLVPVHPERQRIRKFQPKRPCGSKVRFCVYSHYPGFQTTKSNFWTTEALELKLEDPLVHLHRAPKDPKVSAQTTMWVKS